MVAVSPTKALTKAERDQKHRELKEKEMRGKSALERWWGVPGISKPLGLPEDLTDDSLESLARTYRRGLEDVRDGLVTHAAPDLSVQQVEKNLREIERVQGIREALRYSYSATERGTEDRLELFDAGGLQMLVEAEKAGQEPLVRPSYKLALFLDYTRWLEGLLTVFDWSATAPKGCTISRWAREARGWESAAYHALMDVALGQWKEHAGYYAWMELEAS